MDEGAFATFRVFCLYHVCEQYDSDAMYAHYFVKKWSNTSFRKWL